MKHILNMTSFVKEHGEAELARRMHEAHWPKNPTKKKIKRPDNRTGKQAEHITKRIEQIKKFKCIFSIRDVADRLDIPRGQAAHLIKVMLKDKTIRQKSGEGTFKYEVEHE